MTRQWPRCLFAAGVPGAVVAALISAAGFVFAQDEAPRRLTDAVRNDSDWQIGIPEVDNSTDFQAAIRAGTALRSEFYRELDRELRRINGLLDQNPEDAAARQAREALRERLRERVSINLDAGYFYAAGVYIELLKLADAPSEEIDRLKRMLIEQRAG